MSSTMTDGKTVKAAKPNPAAMFDVPMFEMPKFDISKFDLSKFELPKLELPAGLRELAESGVTQARESYAKVRDASEEMNKALEAAYSSAAKGAADYSLVVLDAARASANVTFDYARDLLDAKSVSDIAELSSAHARKQYETLVDGAKELASLAQKVAADAAEPMKRVSATLGKAH